jgi:hypothetical protein
MQNSIKFDVTINQNIDSIKEKKLLEMVQNQAHKLFSLDELNSAYEIYARLYYQEKQLEHVFILKDKITGETGISDKYSKGKQEIVKFLKNEIYYIDHSMTIENNK